MTNDLKLDGIHAGVRARYARIARAPGGCCDSGAERCIASASIDARKPVPE